MESNHLPVADRATARPESLAAMEPGSRLELLCHPYQGCGSPSILAGHEPWIPAADLNRALLITKQVRRHLRLQGMEPIPGLDPGFLNYKSSASPPTLGRRKQRRRPTVRRARAEAQVRDSNPHFRQLGAARRLRSGNLDVGNIALCQLSYGRKLMERSPGVQPG